MKYKGLRDFIKRLEEKNLLTRVSVAVSPHLEMTALCNKVLRVGGPALLFENVEDRGCGKTRGCGMPVLGNLFGTVERVALGMGIDAGDGGQ